MSCESKITKPTPSTRPTKRPMRHWSFGRRNKTSNHQGVDNDSESKSNILYQLNVPPKAKIFKEWISVNVNDSMLGIIYPKTNKQHSFTPTTKDPEPILGDYLNPIERLELKIEACDYSSAKIRETETFNYHRFCELFKALNVDSFLKN